MNTQTTNLSAGNPVRIPVETPKVLRVVHSIHRENHPQSMERPIAELPLEMKNPRLKPYEVEYLNWYHGDPLKHSLSEAHGHSINHRTELMASRQCGCFQCGSRFAPSAITEWVRDSKEDTALCPHCDIDAVLGDASGYPITDDFLRTMKVSWFGVH